MKFTCDQSDLSRFLQIVSRAISTKTTLPILTGILIETKENGLRCVATDLEISVEVMVPGIQIFDPGSVVIPGKTFVEIVRHLPAGPVELSKDTNANMVTISGKNSSFQLPVLPLEEFPMLPNINDANQIKISGTTLKEAIKQTIYATLAEDPRPFLSSVLWEFNDRSLKLVATDINRLAIKEIPVDGSLQTSVLVPVRALKEVMNIFGNNSEEILQISLSDRIILINGSGISFSSRLVEAQFPRYEQVIPKEFTGSYLVKRSNLIDALERSELVCHSVKMKVSPEHLEITAKEPDKGHSFEEVPIEMNGEKIEIGFNGRFLLDFLKSVDSENIIFKYTQEQKPALLLSENKNDYQYIVMPLKLSV